jgi:hypothetical protein
MYFRDKLGEIGVSDVSINMLRLPSEEDSSHKIFLLFHKNLFFVPLL